MKVEDEYGVEFVVKGGDPANRKMLTLKARWFNWIVLPRTTLITGELPAMVSLPDDVLRAARLEECVAVLLEVA